MPDSQVRDDYLATSLFGATVAKPSTPNADLHPPDHQCSFTGLAGDTTSGLKRESGML